MTEVVPTLKLERQFAAPIERVFDAWTQPALFSQWFGPEGTEVQNVEMDLRIGGQYRIQLLLIEENCPIEHYGEYVELNSPAKLSFTWVLANQSCEGSIEANANTLVSIALQANEAGTLLKLTHEKLPSEKARAGHQFGWNSSLDKLDRILTN